MQKPGCGQHRDAPETLLGINITGHKDLFMVKGSNRRRSNGNKQITNKHQLHLSCTPAAGHGSRCKRHPSDRGSPVPSHRISWSPHCTCKQGTQHQSNTIDYLPTWFFWQPNGPLINPPPTTHSEAAPCFYPSTARPSTAIPLPRRQ